MKSDLELAAAELSLPVLDRAAVDALVLFVGDEERPLQGLGGLCDWRLCGALSRTLASGWYRGSAGEALLTPTGRRLGASRLFMFGVGPTASGAAAMADLLPHVFSALRRARIDSCGLSPPWPGMDLPSSLALWSRSAAEGPARQLLLGDSKSIQRWLTEKGGELRWRPWTPPGLPSTAPSAPTSRAG
ncbi:MAG: macro domain-containing protein [Myxococcales bacterium]